MKNKNPLFIYILIFLIGWLVGFVVASDILWEKKPSQEIIDDDYSIRESGYSFINPLLECEIQSKWERQKYIPFEDIVIQRIKTEVIEKNPNITMGIYVRNLNNGPWFGINENENYSPASLMKLPVLMTYLKWIEDDASVLEKKIFYDEVEESSELYFPATKKLIDKYSYSVKELMEEMIIYSDNKSQLSLVKNIPIDLYVKINTDLGITLPNKDTPENFLSVKEVATFFRILYNASYLNRDSSEYALGILSRVTFNKWLRLWVPENIKIAHKFGERGYTDESWKYIRQLHDCGIVYYTNYPYLACIVTKGDNFDANAAMIWETSRIIYEEISSAFPQKNIPN